jgi:hypothetical protein
MKQQVALFILLLLLLNEGFSQSYLGYRSNRRYIASYGIGISSYQGDLNNPKDYFDTKFNTNIGFQKLLHPNISVRSEFTYFRISGDDRTADSEGRVVRNLSFRSDNFELNAVGIFHLFASGPKFYQREKFNPYGFAGIGVLYFNPKGELDGKWYPLQPIQTEGVGYSRVTMVIPMGVGVQVKVNPFINVAIEIGYRKTFTDYLDDVSTVYLDNNSFGDDIHRRLADRRWEIGLPPLPEGNIRGNPSNKDSYLLFNIKGEYYLPIKADDDWRKIMYKRKRNRYRPYGR